MIDMEDDDPDMYLIFINYFIGTIVLPDLLDQSSSLGSFRQLIWDSVGLQILSLQNVRILDGST